MNKKTVLLDLAEICCPTCGFGQIVANYARIYSAMEDSDLRFHFLLPKSFNGSFGDNVDCTKRISKHNKSALPQVNLWHTTNQQQLKTARGKSDKYVVTIHDLNYLREKGWLSRLKHHYRLQKAIKAADAVTCISGFVGQQIEQEFNMYGKKVHVIYDGVEDITGIPQQRPAFASGRPFFFTIGQIRKKKNFHLLVDLMKHLPDYDLYICGDDHFDWAKTVRKHIDANPAHNAFLCGKISQEEKVWLYSHCEAFLFASQGEGFGLPVIEAMQFGKPVFVSNFTCLPEISGDYAYVWSDLNPTNMAELVKEKLPQFAANEKRPDEVKAHAGNFSYDRHIEQYIKLYKKLLCD